MKAFKYFLEVINRRAAFVPVDLLDEVRALAETSGYCLCGGAYDASKGMKILYIDR